MSFPGDVRLDLSSMRANIIIVVEEATKSPNPQAKARLADQARIFATFKKNLPPLPSYSQVDNATTNLKEMIVMLDKAIRTITAKHDDVMSKSPRTWRNLFGREQTVEAAELLERLKALETQRNEANTMLTEMRKQKVDYEVSKSSLPSRELVITTAAKEIMKDDAPDSLEIQLNKAKVARSEVEAGLLKFAGSDAYAFLVETLTTHCKKFLDPSDRPYLTPKVDETTPRILVITKPEKGGPRVEMTTTIGFTGKDEKVVIGQVTATLTVEHNASHEYSTLQAAYVKPVLVDGIAHFADGQKAVQAFPKAKAVVQKATAG